ncbi:hypothetical protein HAX54_031217 [Datura stramonium]|uniref:Uncharacterized protein n=1 Tax=Datura stramonium TaxID=4076 RepID=A0ABS8SBW4_DATST|nr:hypothetical protein [Datura stramonium]
MASMIEQCQVAPPPGCAAELTLPLTYFDVVWTGDSVSAILLRVIWISIVSLVIILENAKDFYPFAPQIQKLSVPKGIAGFQKTWALLNKFGGNEQFLADGLIPFYDRKGFTIAAELIGETIQKRMKDEEWIVKCECIRELRNVDLNLTLSVSGSPKLDLCAVDFGWGRPEKVEFLSIDNAKGVSMSVSKYKDSDKDLEGSEDDNNPLKGFVQKLEYEGVPKYCKHSNREIQDQHTRGLVVVYAKATIAEEEDFGEVSRVVHSQINGLWTQLGDLNKILSTDEKKGGIPHTLAKSIDFINR